MKEKTYFIKSVHTTVHTKHIIVLTQPNYSIPKIYIAKDKNGKPTAAPGNTWHVYFYFRNSAKKMEKVMYRDGINRLKTIKQRKEYGKQLCDAYHELLKSGFDPFTKDGLPLHDFEASENKTIIQAIDDVIKFKTDKWKISTSTNMKFRLDHFKAWCKDVRIDTLDVTEITKRHIISFLKSKNHLSNTSIDNYRRALSVVFGVMSNEGVIPINIAKEIAKIKSTPKKNIPFTTDEIADIKKYLLANDPYLYDFIKFIYYGFLRVTEVARLEPKFIDLKNEIYRVETKKDAFKTKVLVPQLIEVVKNIDFTNQQENYYLFTNQNKPAVWNKSEKTRYDHFRKRFLKVKNHFKLGNLYGMYSFRHSAALDLYKSFEKEGLLEHEIIFKMMPITGHRSEQSLRAYLRDIGSNLPTGYGSRFTADF